MKYETILLYTINEFPEVTWPKSLDAIDTPNYCFATYFSPYIRCKLDDKDEDIIERIFDFLESMAANEDPRLNDLLLTGVLEMLCDTADICKKMLAHVKPKTRTLFFSMASYMQSVKELAETGGIG